MLLRPGISDKNHSLGGLYLAGVTRCFASLMWPRFYEENKSGPDHPLSRRIFSTSNDITVLLSTRWLQ